MPRKICVFTGTRADYGLLYGLLTNLNKDANITLQTLVTGTHLSEAHGNTWKIIEKDGFPISARVGILGDDDPVGIAASIGKGVTGFAKALDDLQPDILVILGDRYESLAAAQAAMVLRIPIAHIHGGEATEGLIDEAVRHAITKIAHLHFTVAEPYRDRVIQMGEDPGRVFNVGAPGLDNLYNLDLMSKEELENNLSFDMGDCCFLVTYHPVTLDTAPPVRSFQNLLDAFDSYPEAKIIITGSNADTAGQSLNQLIEDFARAHPDRVYSTASLGQQRYLSALSVVDVVIGNSSSGLLEAPSAGTPTVNIGNRQKGRLRTPSIIDCGESPSEIMAAIDKALSPDMQAIAARKESPYGQGGASTKIADILKNANLDGILFKSFFDLNKGPS